MLDPKVFFTLCNTFGMPEIDMFATRLNKQLERYVSWAPDPGSIAIDAMSTSWRNKYIYIFPPFSMYWPIIKKIQQEAEKALIIAPMWPTETWFPTLLRLAIKTLLIFNSSNLRLPGTNHKHPLSPKMKLMAILCSKDVHLQQRFLQTLPEYCQQHGGRAHPQNMNLPSKNSQSFVVKSRLLLRKQILP